ncbi:MAG: type II/IV secretion system ATPase subunit [Archaeoglobaceae archaeon]|nr:type II/IV secretion system ATPase subunit [Archaeoglobaceae archaeon]MDW7990303.1 type II/IV secretion system ATPase subunit [Archaeoglobaceae archaeon]
MIRRKKKEISIQKLEMPDPPNAKEVYYCGDVKIAITDKYEVIAPDLPENFDSLLEEVVIKYSALEGEESEEKLFQAFLEVAIKRDLEPSLVSSAWYHIRNACLYYGKITPLFQDKYIEDISCSGPEQPVFVYHQKYGFIPTNISFSREELQRFIHSLAQRSGFILSSDNPIVDSTLPDGSRVSITLEVSMKPSYTIRKVKASALTPKKLIENKTWPPEVAALLWIALENRCSMMFIGGTATGKTTAMNAAAFFIPPFNRIVSIEDTHEIMLPHLNWTPLIVKNNTTTYDLLKASLRQRPEYIILGEARGIEVREMFSAMGIGHSVLTTFHGANAQSVARRLLGDPFQIKSDQFRLLDFIITMSFTANRGRKCSEIMLVGEGDIRLVADLFGTKIFEDGEKPSFNFSPAFERIAEKGMKKEEEIEIEFNKKLKLISVMPSEPEDFIKFLKVSLEGGRSA